MRQGRVLICQRARSGPYPLQWEFPGGKLEAGETEPEALARELREELGLGLTPGQIGPLVTRLRHEYPRTGAVELAFYRVPDAGSEPRNLIFESILWELPAGLASYDFLPADRPVLSMLGCSALTCKLLAGVAPFCTVGKIDAKGCEIRHGGPPPGKHEGAAPARRSVGLGPRAPNLTRA